MRAAVKASVFALTVLWSAGCVGDDATTSATDEPLSATDPQYGLQQWHFNEANIPNAWNTTTGSASTIVAVIDSGTMPHPDLDAKWVSGYDFYAGDANPADDSTYHHGIHVAGIIAAVTDNGVGVAGVCWSCKLMSLRAAQANGRVQVGAPGLVDALAPIARAIRYAAGDTVDDGTGNLVHTTHPASVINISLGNNKATSCRADVQAALNYAYAANVPVVVAAGNNDDGDATSTHYLWENCNHAIVVTAAQESGAAEPYAIRGAGITLAAPGGSAVGGADGHGALIGCTDPTEPRGDGTHGVVSTWVTAQGVACYRHWAGTSMAAPHVSGIVALMKSRNPSLTTAQTVSILSGTARAATACGSACGAGIVDASAAVRAALVTATPDCESSGGGGFSCVFDDVTGMNPLSVQWTAASNATLTAPTNSANGVVGRCTVGTSATINVTVTDGLGRSVTAHRGFVCTKIVN